MSDWTKKRLIDSTKMYPATFNTLMKFVGAKDDEDVVNYAILNRAGIGRERDPNERIVKAYLFVIELYNAKIEYEKEKLQEKKAREKKKAQEKKAQEKKKAKEEEKKRKIEERRLRIEEERRVMREPRFVRKDKTGTIKFFEKYRFTYDNVKDYEGLYKAIKDAIKRDVNETQFITLHIISKLNENRVRSITIRITDMESFRDFENALNLIVSGQFVGSDAVNLEEEEIYLNRFDLSFSSIARGFGSPEKMLFKVKGINGSNGDCGKLCLLHVLDDLELKQVVANTPSKNFQTLQGIINWLECKRDDGEYDMERYEIWAEKLLKENIKVIANSFALKRPNNEIVNGGERKVFMIADAKRKGMMRKHIGSKFTREDVELITFKHEGVIGDEVKVAKYYHVADKVKTIIYDEYNEHFDIYDGDDKNYKFQDNVYLTLEGNIIKNNKIIFNPKQLNTNNKIIKPPSDSFIFFDYETIIDFNHSSCMKEYSLSILELDNFHLEELIEADMKNDIEKVNEIRRRRCRTFLGYDCSNMFIEWLLKNENDKVYTFVGFNNSNFDNFILLDAVLKYQKNMVEINVSDIFYNGNQLLNFKISGRHGMFDIHKHLMGSLSANCKSFKINCCAKKSFDHNKAQELHENGGLMDFIKGNEELKEYNEFDVLATAVLFGKYRSALSNIKATKDYAKDLHNVKTIGSLIYKVFESKAMEFPKLDYKKYTDLQKYKVAGRVELFNGIQKVMERLVSTDVCSLYPYVMSVAPVYYPCGEIIETDVYQGDDVLGFYYCDVDQSNLKKANLPNIYARKTEIENDWAYEGVLENYLLSNVMIRLLKKFNCQVVIKNGFYFTEKKKSCDMFDFILDFMKEKNKQDTLNKEKMVEYNPALRETLKLLMNSLSGKVIEGLHTEKTTDVNSLSEYEAIKKKAVSINTINTIGNKIFMSYEVDGEKLCKKTQRPIYLGVLIYDYAKSYMYENSYSKVGLDELLYTDTDASKFRYKKFLDWKAWIDTNNIQVPHFKEVEEIDPRYKDHKIYDENSKVFGSFEDELSGMTGKDYVFYCLQKKSWCYSVDGKDKFRFKGLNDDALLLTINEKFIETKNISVKGVKIAKKYIPHGKEKEVYDFAIANKSMAIGENATEFFEKLYTDRHAYLLCCSFRKIVKNSARNVLLEDEDKYNTLMNKVQVNYTMKKVIIN